MSFNYFGRKPSRPRHRGRVIVSRNGYGENWPKQRARALKRDNYTCQKCGHIGHKKSNGRWSVSVHHIRKIAWFVEWKGTESVIDYEKANDLSNLITLCDICHKTADGHRKMEGFNSLKW